MRRSKQALSEVSGVNPLRTEHDSDPLNALVDATMQGRGLVGLAAGAVVGAKPVLARAIGQANVEAGRTVTPETRFRIASVTKTFTAVALMQLVEQGRVSLDDAVNDHLKLFRVEHRDPKVPPVLIRHLLTHSSGLTDPLRSRDLLDPSRVFGPKDGRPVPSLTVRYGRVVRPRLSPEREWMYSNDGFAILGQVVEDITATPYAQYVTEAIFLPLGMTRTNFEPYGGDPNSVAVGYRLKRSIARPVAYRNVPVLAAGGAFSTLEDMLLYMEALCGGGANRHGRVLQPETLSAMFEPHRCLGGRVPYQGWCFFLDSEERHRVASHPGDLAGFEAGLTLAPDIGSAAFAVANRHAGGAAQRLSLQLVRSLLGLSPNQLDGNVRAPADVAEELVGDYRAAVSATTNPRSFMMAGGRLRVRYEDGQLVMRSRLGVLHSPRALKPVASEDPLWYRAHLHGFYFEDTDMNVVFAANSYGRVDHLELGLVGSRFDRVGH